MSTFASTESDLSQRIRRTLNGRARRMGTRARVLAAILLCPLAAATLPSYGAAAEVSPVADEPRRDEFLFMVVHQDGSMRLNQETVTLETLGEQLQAKQQILDNPRIVVQHDERAPGRQITKVIDIVQQAGLVMLAYPVISSEEGHGILQEALAADPEEWSEELKAWLIELQSDSTIEEMARLVRARRLWLKAANDRIGSDQPDSTTSGSRTIIPYGITVAASVELVIYNVAGQPVRTLVLGRRSPGEHRLVWDRRDDEGRELGSGLYFCFFKTDAGETWQKKVSFR